MVKVDTQKIKKQTPNNGCRWLNNAVLGKMKRDGYKDM